MKAYKAFNSDLTCTKGEGAYQYKEGIIHTTSEAKCRRNGFHCTENPLDCIQWYPKWEESAYYIVVAAGDINEEGDDTKLSCTKLKLIKKLTMKEFMIESITYMAEHPDIKWSNEVLKDTGHADKYFKIIRGKEPTASGELGTMLGLVKECISGNGIMRANILEVDGINIMPGVLYTVEGIMAERQEEEP